jgi:hypothetical protein
MLGRRRRPLGGIQKGGREGRRFFKRMHFLSEFHFQRKDLSNDNEEKWSGTKSNAADKRASGPGRIQGRQANDGGQVDRVDDWRQTGEANA